MKNYGNAMKNKFSIMLQISIYGAIFLAFFGWDKFIGPLTDISIWLIASIITTGVIQVFLQGVTGDFLEKIPFTYEFKGIKISISLFVIVTVILKLTLF
ncbi:MAG: hypothetical protein ABH824_05655 [Nanoarchaeota archaeon]